jgi:hypothetical protein
MQMLQFFRLNSPINLSHAARYGLQIVPARVLLGSLSHGGTCEKKTGSEYHTNMKQFVDKSIIFQESSRRDYQGKGKEDSMWY